MIRHHQALASGLRLSKLDSRLDSDPVAGQNSLPFNDRQEQEALASAMESHTSSSVACNAKVPLRDGVTARRFTQYKVDTVQLKGMGPLSPNIVGYARRNDPRQGAAQPDEVVEGLTVTADA
jgi:hypothetical protein